MTTHATPGAPGPAPADARLHRLAGDIVALARDQLLNESTWGPLAALTARWQDPVARVAVVGEVSAGKSTLINALVGTAVLPAAVEALSAVPVELRHGAHTLATVLIHDGEKVVSRTLAEQQDILDYLTTRGERTVTRRHGRAARVLAAELSLPSPLLARGLRLVDTPGVGGLNPAHRRRTMAILADTDAVLFVTKPGEPVSESQLRFLAESADRVHTHVLVQTHRDQSSDAAERLADGLAVIGSPATWEALAGDDPERARLLAERFARIPHASVSGRMALDALPDGPEQPGDEAAFALSGIAGLAGQLDEHVISRARRIHREDLLRLAEHTATALRARLEERRALLGAEEDVARAIREREERVYRWVKDGGDDWRADLDAAVTAAREETRELAAQRVRTLRAAYADRFARLRPKQIEEHVKELLAEPDALLAELGERVRAHLVEAVRRIDARHPGDPVTAHLERLRTAGRLAAQLPATTGPEGGAAVDDLYVTGVSTVGLTAFAREFGRNWTGPDDRNRPAGPMDPRTPASVAASSAFSARVLVPLAVAAMVFNRIAAWRRRKADTLTAARNAFDQVVSVITTEAVAEADRQAQLERDALAEIIDAELAGEQAQITRDRDDLDRLTRVAPAERTALLNETDLLLRRVEELLAGLAAIRAGTGE